MNEPGDLADLTAFVAVRPRPAQLGVRPSALSHSMRQLEERLGMHCYVSSTGAVGGDPCRRRAAIAK